MKRGLVLVLVGGSMAAALASPGVDWFLLDGHLMPGRWPLNGVAWVDVAMLLAIATAGWQGKWEVAFGLLFIDVLIVLLAIAWVERYDLDGDILLVRATAHLTLLALILIGTAIKIGLLAALSWFAREGRPAEPATHSRARRTAGVLVVGAFIGWSVWGTNAISSEALVEAELSYRWRIVIAAAALLSIALWALAGISIARARPWTAFLAVAAETTLVLVVNLWSVQVEWPLAYSLPLFPLAIGSMFYVNLALRVSFLAALHEGAMPQRR